MTTPSSLGNEEAPPGEPDVNTFFGLRVPEQFDRTLERQRAAAQSDPEAKRVLEEMEAVRTSVVVRVDRGDRSQHDEEFAFDIERGSMAVRNVPTYPPFLIMRLDRADFPNLRRECGDSLLGFLGGLAGLGDEMRLTSQRVRNLRELGGSLVFERTGERGFTLLSQFGEDTPDADPRATIQIDEATYAQLRSGELDPHDAFLASESEVIGDEGMAIELALTALAPD